MREDNLSSINRRNIIKYHPKRYRAFSYLIPLLGGIVISLLGYIGFLVYQQGYEQGKLEATIKLEAASERIRDAKNTLAMEREREFQKLLTEAQRESKSYLEKLDIEKKLNDNLRKALGKKPEVIVRYRECVYTEEDHQYTLELYQNLNREDFIFDK